MAKYASGENAEIGDVVRCTIRGCNCGDDDVVEAISGSNVLRHGTKDFFEAQTFELVSRAPSPEPEQAKVNGVYASGEVPEVGDLVECIEEHGHHTVNSRFTVESFNCVGNIVSIGSGHGTAPRRFKLIHRKEQPAAKHEQSPPLVVWPEEPKVFDFLHVPKKSLFVARRYPQTVLYKDNEGNFHVIAGEVVDGLNHSEHCRLVRVTDGVTAFTVI